MGAVTRVFGWQTAGGAEQHFRIDLPWTAINGEDFQLMRGGEAELRDLLSVGAVDVVFAHRLAGHSPLWHQICDNPSVLAVYDLDDDILCIDPQNTIPYAVFHPLEEETRLNVMHADVLTVSSVGLLQKYSAMRPRVYMLPMVIPDWLPELPMSPTFGTDRMVVGWAGSMHKAQDWEAENLAPQLAELLKQSEGGMWPLRLEPMFSTIGGDYTRGMLPSSHHRHRPFTTVRDYYESIDFNVGLAPLMRSPFNDGKTITKVIEYGARGVPTIGSDVGDYSRVIFDGVNGALVREGGPSFLDILYELNGEPSVRRRMGREAWYLAHQYTASQQAHHWECVFRGEV